MFSLCLTKCYAMKVYGEVEVVSFKPLPFYPRETVPGTIWIGGWVGPKAGFDQVEKRKFLTLPGLELQTLSHPACSLSLYRLESNWIYVTYFMHILCMSTWYVNVRMSIWMDWSLFYILARNMMLHSRFSNFRF
jgi:hypothetical protein